MAHLITGHAGKAHVKASDEARINKALYGNIEVAVDFGNNLAITLPSNNSVQIDTGLFYMQGRWIDIPAPEIVTFENGVAGMNRNDLVVLRYEMDSDSSVETAELVVKKGDSVSGIAADPELETGQIDSGALVNEVPLYRIPISSINIGEPVQLFEVKQINLDTYARKTELNGAVLQGTKITDVTQITSGGMYYSNGNVANAPTSDGVYYDYVAIPHGWIVNLIARSGSDGATYVSINSTSDGSTWTNSGWSRLMTRDDITADGDNLILNWL